MTKIEAKRAETLKTIPPTCRKRFIEAWSGKSRASAVEAFCLYCVMYVRDEVDKCTAPTCPLYEYRPTWQEDFQKPKELDEKTVRLRQERMIKVRAGRSRGTGKIEAESR